MANESESSGSKPNLKRLAPGQEVERAAVAADGTVTIAHGKGRLASVDIADVDLLLSFTDGSFVVIPNGALDALGADSKTVVFTDGKAGLDQVFKLAGTANPAKAGSLRLVSENIDAARPPADEQRAEEAPALEPPPPPAPMVRVGIGTPSGNKGPGQGPGIGGSGTGEYEGEVPATVVPLSTPQPPVYRVGQKTQSVEDLLHGTGLGQPNFTQALYTSSEFKVTPSGRVDLPLGAFDPAADTTQLAVRANPQHQATREVINGTGGADTIDFNPAFSAGEGQWSKTLHLTINNFSDLTDIQLVFNAAKIALIPGFDVQGLNGAVVTRDGPTSNSWHVTPDPAMLLNGLDLALVYNVNDSAAPVDFGADIIINGHAGLLAFEVTNNLNFTWRDAVTEADFTVTSSTGDPLMVLPRAGVGVEVFAGNGNDVVHAGAGPDLVHGEAGNDTLFGGHGNDVLDGGTGADVLNGEQGSDTATYENAAAGVTATLDLTLGVVNTNDAAGDTYTSVENLTGSAFNDILIGDSSANVLTGGSGDDKLVGGGDADTLDGGSGTDTASYEYSTGAVTVSLTTNTGSQGDAVGDVLISIENLIGGAGNDTFTGAAGVQANAFDGRGGTDTVSYAPSTAGVVVTLDPLLLLSPLAQTNDAAGDTFTSIENLTGSGYDDTLIGNGVANVLNGGVGNDTLEGLGGADSFVGSAGTDTVSYANSTAGVVSSLTTVFAAGPAVTQTNDALGDTYSSIENMVGTGFADTLIGESGNNVIDGGVGDDILEGMDGADQLIGGTGTDTASYAHASGYVMASLTTGLAGFANQGHASGDTYSSIENLTGSDFGDTLIGDTGINILTGGTGDDVLEGMGGADQLVGGTGTNTASYEHSADAGGGIGVTASLVAPAGNTGDAAGDTYSNIQNLVGTAFADTLTGDNNANVLTGGDGNDIISGGGGADTLYGNAGNDSITDDLNGAARIYAGDGDDTVTMTSDDNQLDLIDGGTGTDTLVWNYAGSLRVDINMVGGTVQFAGPVSGTYANFTNFENVTAAGSNSLYVYADNNNNILTGGSGTGDYVDYRYATGGVKVNISGSAYDDGNGHTAAANLSTGGSGTDTLSGFEHIYAGSQWDDVLIGNAGDNTIRGYYGNDFIDGGAGIDTWYIDWSGNLVTASLLTAAQNAALGIVMTGDAAGDTVVNMENIYATYSQTGGALYGNALANTISGSGLLEGFIGADTITGLATTATASYANAGSAALAGVTTATGVGVIATLTTSFAVGPAVVNTGDAAGDTYNSNVLSLMGSAFDDTLIGNASANTLTGGAGNDKLEGLAGADAFLGGAGTDTVSYEHSTAGVVVDLQNRGIYTATNDAVGDTFNSIENFTGSNFNDTVYGTSGDNLLVGGLGNDTLNGEAGFDTVSYLDATGAVSINLATNTVTGAAGTDTLVSIEKVIGSQYGDTITGSAGDDVIDAGPGTAADADTINGGAGNDTVSYASAATGKTVNLATGTSSDGDTLVSIENIVGTASGDSLTGDGGDNVIEGGLGDDLLDGGANAAGGDTASYASAASAVTVSLAIAGAQVTGGAGTDILSNFENLLGSDYNDTLTGNGSNNALNGGAGDDLLVGGAGADTLTGGTGTDTVSYASAAAAVSVTINGAGTLGDANGDVLSGIENLVGSDYNDTLIGDGAANVITGGAGDDTLNGAGGIDTVSYASAAGGVTVNLASIFAQNTVGAGIDTLSNFENILGSAFADTLTGDGGSNTIEGGAGNDTLNGAGGNDTVSYASASSGVTVSLATALAQNTFGAGTDTLSSFENILGSAFNDTLTGDLNANTLDGGTGDDVLIGGAGADSLIGGAGTNTASYSTAASAVTANLTTGSGTLGDANGDTFSGIQNLTGSNFNDNLTGDSNANVLDGGLGNDTLTGNAGNDTLDVRFGRDTASGGNDDDTFWVDSNGGANLPTLVDGGANTAWTSGGGDAVKLFNLVNGGSYTLTALAGVTNNMEILDIRDGVNTTLNLASLDVRNFADGGNGSQIWVRANTGDTINVNLVAGETLVQVNGAAGIDYTVFNASAVQVGQVHLQYG